MYLLIQLLKLWTLTKILLHSASCLMPAYVTELPPVSTNFSESYSSVTPLKSRLQTFISWRLRSKLTHRFAWINAETICPSAGMNLLNTVIAASAHWKHFPVHQQNNSHLQEVRKILQTAIFKKDSLSSRGLHGNRRYKKKKKKHRQ